MSTDRELLELAAKAADIPYGTDRIDCGLSITGPDGRHTSYPQWNPLTDDGDALRLAIDLGICIEPYPLYTQPKHSIIAKQRHRSDQLRGANPTEKVELYHESDSYAATRRAVVRAAAEIGRREA